jgi:transposase InsO family protein
MSQVYAYYDISRQAHFDEGRRLAHQATLHNVYVGMMAQTRQLHPAMGLRKMYNQLQPEGIGRDAFIALGLQEGYRLLLASNPARTTYAVRSSRYGNLLVDGRFHKVNQVWVSDLFYFSWKEQHLYVVLIMDVVSRRIVGAAGGDHMRGDLFTKALRRALTLRGKSDYAGELIHHSDRGSQYASTAYVGLLEASGIRISMCATVLENAHAERVNSTIKNDYLRHWPLRRADDFDALVRKATDHYNQRFHDSLKMTPSDYEVWLQRCSEQDRPSVHVYTERNTQIMNDTGQLDLFQTNDLL